MTEEADVRGAADDELLAALFDRFLDEVLEGRDADLDPWIAEHPELRAEIEETWRLARETAGRRSHSRPVIEGYRLIRELGRGGMGVVYLAEHENLGRQVALKILPAAASLSPSAKRRFLTEARALARVDSDHVVRIHNIIEREDLLAYEMEWVDGTSFRDLLTRLSEGRRDPTITDARRILGAAPGQLGERSLLLYYVRIGISIARALACVHEAGLVHRDVKPSNILIRRDGTALLADFGLVRGTDASVTRTAGFVGTLRYASPEQLREDRDDVDARTDVYALGVSLWEAIAGRAPFDGNSSVALLRKIESGAAPRLRRVAPHVPRDLETVLNKAMEPNPGARYASAAEFADDLERVLRLEPVRARPVGSLRRTGRWLRRHRRYAMVGAVGAMLGAAVFLPGMVEARGREHRESRTAALVEEARRTLMSTIEVRPAAAMEEALAAYGAAVEADPSRSDLLAERAIVSVAAGVANDEMLRQLPPSSRATATAAAAGEAIEVPARSTFESAEPLDRAMLGLLGYLLGEAELVDVAWSEFDSLGDHRALVEAGLRNVERRMQRVDELVERARTSLLSPIARTRAFSQAVLGSPAQASRIRGERTPLDSALRDYDHALTLSRQDHRLRVEREVVAVAASSNSALAGLTQRVAPNVELLPPVTADVARQLLRGSLVGTLDARATLEAALEDRAALGLLAYLVGDLALCERAWYGFDSLAGDHPVTDAALGVLYRVDGRPERAYGRLLRAVRAFPEAHFLLADLASVALSIGELQLALQWSEQFRAMPDADPELLEFLDGELAAATGNWERARESFLHLSSLPNSAIAILAELRLADVERRSGESETAAARLRSVLDRWPEAASARLALGELALERNDRSTYLRQVVWAVDSDYCADRSPGTLRDVRALLRIGGLRGLHDEAVRRTGSQPTGSEPFFWPPSPLIGGPFRDTASVEALVRTVVAFDAMSGAFWLPSPDDPTHGPAAVGSVVVRSLVCAPAATQGLTGWRRIVVQLGALAAFPKWQDLVVDVLPALLMIPDPTMTARCMVRRWDGDASRGAVGVVSVVEDLDGDGRPDLLIGPLASSPMAGNRLRVCSAVTGEEMWQTSGRSDLLGFGDPACLVGDIDGNGTGELAVAAIGTDRVAPGAGAVALVSPREDGVRSVYFGQRQEGRFGMSVAGIGDVDGDGLADLAVGETGEMAAVGRVLIFSGLRVEPIRTLEGPPGGLFGTSLASVGDIDADGVPDLAIGAMAADQARGRVYIYSGASGALVHELSGGPGAHLFGMSLEVAPQLAGGALLVGAPVSFVDGQKRGALFVFRIGSWERLAYFPGERELDSLGTSSTVGDFDGDGIPDIAVGAGLARRNGEGSGEVVVFDGASLDTPRVIGRFRGEGRGASLGASLAAYPDVDGNGRDELLMGAPGAREGYGSVLMVELPPRR